jgi:hypothetical protein
MGCKQNSTNITTTLGLGSIDSPYYVQVHIVQRLCSPVSENQVPIFNPTFSVVSFAEVGSGQYVAIVKVEGIIYYNPCGGNTCATRMLTINETFPIPFASTTAPTSVTISAGTIANSLSMAPCQSSTREFVSDVPISLTVA